MGMHKPYIAKEIETKWQKEWQKNNAYKASADKKDNYYVL